MGLYMNAWLRWALVAMTLIAFGLRMVHLGDVPPRWDEGWSVAHASLSLAEIFSITVQDVHPPLYYMLLGGWQAFIGVNLFGARLLSVLLALPTVPLAYVTARAWVGSRRVAVFAAGIIAWLPLLVYYSAVVRMYALAPSFILLATYGLLRVNRRQHLLSFKRGIAPIAVFVVGAIGAMLTLYHAAWALIALGLYVLGTALIRRSPSVIRILGAIALALLCYLPWAVYALPQLAARASAEAATNTGRQLPLSYFLRIGIAGLALAQPSNGWGLIVIGALVLIAFSVAVLARRSLRHILLPGLMITFTVLFVALAARQWALNERMLVGAAPGLALLLAWSLDALMQKGSYALRMGAPGIAVAALLMAYWSTSTDFVYRKTLEVFDPYNPHTYYQNIAPQAQPNDIIFFNVLSPAGFYALDRQPNDPHWSYALTWDPVKEPRHAWEERVLAYAQTHARMWFVLYRGLAGNNGDLRGWLDSSFYPASAQWGEEEVFYGLYGFPPAALSHGDGKRGQWGAIQLADVQFSPRVSAGDIIAVRLDWQVLTQIPKNYKIFVHARAPDGSLIAQHDAMPLNDLRPMSTLPAGETVRDNHGLPVPLGFTGPLNLFVGLYDPASGVRLPTQDGLNEIQIGQVTVIAK